MSTTKLPEIRSTEEFQARNWKQLGKKEIQKLDAVERSRYMAYETVSKQAAKDMFETRRRIHEKRKNDMKEKSTLDRLSRLNPEQDKHAKLIGQLKAAEARNRIRLMRLRYSGNKASEMNNLIACQPSAIKAVRLQCLVPPHPEKITIRDLLGKDERSRVDTLLEDELNLTTNLPSHFDKLNEGKEILYRVFPAHEMHKGLYVLDASMYYICKEVQRCIIHQYPTSTITASLQDLYHNFLRYEQEENHAKFL